MASADIEEDEEPKKSSLVGAIILPLILLLLSGGMGFAFAKFHVAPMITIQDLAMTNDEMSETDAKDTSHKKEEGETEIEEIAMGQTIVPLEPIVTNLSDPSDVWVRAEFSIIFSEVPETGVAERIQSDFVAYLKTVKLQNLEGSIGFHHLMEDLEDRAHLLSEEKANKVLVRAFIVE